MRQTTQKLITRLVAARPGEYRVDVAKHVGDSEIIHLHDVDISFPTYLRDDCVLSVDEDDAIPYVALEASMEVGGNVLIADWVIDGEDVLDEIINEIVASEFYFKPGGS